MSALKVSGEQMAILSSRMRKITEKMANTLFRAARSGVINTARDFSCCLVTRDNQLLDAADSLPVQVLCGPELSAAHMCARHPKMRAGDAYLNNSPYHGGSHAADHQILVPIFDSAGAHRLTAVVKAHMADIGNAMPTTINPSAADVYQEGALIFPSVQVQRDYEDIQDIMEMCQVRFRAPQTWRGDYLAMVGSARTAEREILQLASEVGWDLLDAHITQWLDYSEQRMAEALSALPAGRTEAQTCHDPLPGTNDAIPIKAIIETRPDEGRIIIDLTQNPDCLPTGMNLTEATALASARMGVYCGLGARVPANSGAFRRVEVRLRENCCVGIPRHPSSCSAATTSFTGRVAGMVQLAMSELGDGVGMAEHGVAGAGIIPIFGADPRRRMRPFVDAMAISWGGGGGGPIGDGLLGDTSAAGGVTFRHATEICELQLPVCIWIDRLEADTAAAGAYRGAPAHRVEWSPVDCPVMAMWVGDGGRYPARGARGGADAVPNSVVISRADGARETPPMAGMTMLQPGDRYASLSAGGGGYGAPSARSRTHIDEDVAEGILTREKARADYGYAPG